MTAAAHVLVVPEAHDDGLDAEHPPECPFEDSEYQGRTYDCPVGWEVLNVGPEFYFLHRDAPPDALDGHVERLPPGRYEIEAWDHVYPAGPWGSEEYDGGLRRVEAEDTPAPAR